MTITTLSSRDLNQDIGRAKRAANDGPVIITDHGRPAHVLLSYEQYQRITGQKRSLLDTLSQPAGIEDIDFDFEISREVPGPVDLA